MKVLIESSGTFRMSDADERELYTQIASMYHIDRSQRRLITLLNILPKHLDAHLRRWVQGGQYGHLFDNADDNLTIATVPDVRFRGSQQVPADPGAAAVLHPAPSERVDLRPATCHHVQDLPA